jgi:hypothetical protein
LATIDKLNTRLDSLKNELLTNKLDSAQQYSIEAIDNETRIKNYFIEDTIDMVFAEKMTRYKNMRRAFKHMYLEFDNIVLGCDEVKETLRQLRHDIENGDGDRAKYGEYLNFEKSKFDKLEILAKDYFDAKKTNVATFRELNPELHDFSLKVQAKNQKL